MIIDINNITCKIVCFLEDKRYVFDDGKHMFESLRNYSIKEMYASDDKIVMKLEKRDDQLWIEEYKKQFGKEPSFF